jgi:ribonuclease P protein component
MTHQRRAHLATFFESSTKIRGKLANSFYLIENNEPSVEGYVLASKKGVSKLATLRNRAKRRLRVAQRIVLRNHPNPSSTHSIKWVIMSGRGSLKAPWTELLKEIEQQWQSIVATLG